MHGCHNLATHFLKKTEGRKDPNHTLHHHGIFSFSVSPATSSQDKDNIERLEILGVGDPSGQGLGFSYVRTAPKASMSNAVMKKKIVAACRGSSVTGMDANLRRLSTEVAQVVLLKFNVFDEVIAKQEAPYCYDTQALK